MSVYKVVPVGQTGQELAGRLMAAGHLNVVISPEFVEFEPFTDGKVFKEFQGWREGVEAHFSCLFVDSDS